MRLVIPLSLWKYKDQNTSLLIVLAQKSIDVFCIPN